MMSLYQFYRLLFSTRDQPQGSTESSQAEFDRILQYQMVMLTLMCSRALLNECMNSGSPSLAGKGLGVRLAQSSREIDLSLNPSPTGEGL
jgi:hypothetical protein